MNDISLILLAAGLSTRSGARHKLTEALADHLAVLRPLPVARKIVVLSERTRAFVSDADLSGFLPVLNPDPARGMMSSIQLAIQSSSGAGFLISLADLVELRTEHYLEVLNAARATGLTKLIAPFYGEERGHPVFIPAAHREEILAMPVEDRGLKRLWRDHPSHHLKVGSAAYVRDRDQ